MYIQSEVLLKELEEIDEFTKEHMHGDFDNKIINICCCLHYNKENFSDSRSAVLLEKVRDQLIDLYYY